MDGNFRGFGITNFADKDHIRILADDGTKGIGKSKPNRRFNLNLIHPPQLIFYGILNGNNLFCRRVDLL